MGYLNSVFAVLLVILLAVAAFGYLINESQDQSLVISEQESEILALKAKLSEQDAKCQVSIKEVDGQRADAQADLDQCRLEYQQSVQDLSACRDTPAPTLPSAQGNSPNLELKPQVDLQLDQSAQPTQADPSWVVVVPDNLILIIGLIGGVVVVIVLVLGIKMSPRPISQPAAKPPAMPAPAPSLYPMQFTVKMDGPLYQEFQDYLKRQKK